MEKFSLLLFYSCSILCVVILLFYCCSIVLSLSLRTGRNFFVFYCYLSGNLHANMFPQLLYTTLQFLYNNTESNTTVTDDAIIDIHLHNHGVHGPEVSTVHESKVDVSTNFHPSSLRTSVVKYTTFLHSFNVILSTALTTVKLSPFLSTSASYTAHLIQTINGLPS